MNRRDFCTAAALLPLTGCGGAEDMGQEFTLQSSPIRTGHLVNAPVPQYAEGTWVPSVGGDATYAVQVGHYVKIGRLVVLMCSLSIANIGTGSTTDITGLPFSVLPLNSAAPVYFADLTSNVVYIVANARATLDLIELSSIAAAGTTLAATGVIGNNTVIRFTLSYFTKE